MFCVSLSVQYSALVCPYFQINPPPPPVHPPLELWAFLSRLHGSISKIFIFTGFCFLQRNGRGRRGHAFSLYPAHRVKTCENEVISFRATRGNTDTWQHMRQHVRTRKSVATYTLKHTHTHTIYHVCICLAYTHSHTHTHTHKHTHSDKVCCVVKILLRLCECSFL